MVQCRQGTERLQQPAVEMERVDKREKRESVEQCSWMDSRLGKVVHSDAVGPKSALSVCDLVLGTCQTRNQDQLLDSKHSSLDRVV
jgi:hypothetical protein